MPDSTDKISNPPNTATPDPNTISTEQAKNPDRHDRWIDRLRARLGLKPTNSIRQNLEEVLEENAPASAGFTPEERSMLRNILELRESRAGDLAIPRADIVAVQKDMTLGEIMQEFEEAGHTRLVVYDDTLDDPVGMVHIKDIVTFILGEARKVSGRKRAKSKESDRFDLGVVDLAVTLSATKLVRPLLFIPPSMPAIDLLERMQATRIQLALVVDEYGGTDGLVTVKDIVESIVGDIDDEHDESNEKLIVAHADGSYIADARAPLEDLKETLGPDFEPGEDVSDEVDTLGGYLTVLAGHVPVRGEVVASPGDFEFEVLDADPRRVKRVKIHRGRGQAGRVSRQTRRKEPAELPQATPAPPAGLPVPSVQAQTPLLPSQGLDKAS